MSDGLWQYAIGPISVAIGGALTLWWQSRTSKADKEAEQERQRDHDDLAELRAYRKSIDDELQRCRSSEAGMLAHIAGLRAESVGLTHKVEALTDDLRQALDAIKTATNRIDALEAEKADLEMTVRVIGTDRDALKVKLDALDNDVRKRRLGQLKTRATDK